MIDEVFTVLYDALMGSMWLAVLASFAWGILSIVLSPCHISSVPLVVGFISSQGTVPIKRTFVISLVFSSGILITIAAIGMITASLGRMLGDIGSIGNYIVALVFFVVGLYLLDIIKLNWNTIGVQPTKSKGLLAALLLGLLFGLALGPCTFAYMAPILGLVFETARTNYVFSVMLLLAFAIGHCSVIVGAGTLAGKVQTYLDWSEGSKTVSRVKKACGILVLLGGLYMLNK